MTYYEDQRPEYVEIEVAVLRERQRAISASCFTADNGFIHVVVCYPRSENSQILIDYEVVDNKAHALNDVFNDVITLWEKNSK